MICLPSDRRALLEPDHPELSIRRQCELLHVNRTSIYYSPVQIDYTDEQLELMRLVDEVWSTDITYIRMQRGFVERLWRSVKYECVYLGEWNRVKEARNDLREYFNFYNNERPHQSLNGMTPAMVHHANNH